MTPQGKADKEFEIIAWMNKHGYDRKASKDIAPIIVKYLDEVVKNNFIQSDVKPRFQKILEEELIWLNNMEIDISEIESYDIDSETRRWLKVKVQDRKEYIRSAF